MKLLKNTISTITAFTIAIFLGIGAVQAQDVVEVVNESEDHTVFAELLEEAELKDLLKQEGPYTVLAPTNDAFEQVEDLETLKEDKEQLQTVIVGHLFQGQIASADVEQARDINITDGDIEASNGTVHVVDEVLLE